MTEAAEQIKVVSTDEHPTLWGLDAAALHDRFWASRGVQVIRYGQKVALEPDAELLLLLDPEALVLFQLNPIIEVLTWEQPDVVFLRLHARGQSGYRERVVSDKDDRLVKIERCYNDQDWRLTRAAVTDDRQLAGFWQDASNAGQAWRELRGRVFREFRRAVSVQGKLYHRPHEEDQVGFIHELMKVWSQPGATISRAKRLDAQVWHDDTAELDPNNRYVAGPVWVGANRKLTGQKTVIGPAIIWDDPEAKAEPGTVPWGKMEPGTDLRPEQAEKREFSLWFRVYRRIFDICFALFALALTLPFYPLIMLLIWIEDRSPFFYIARRESLDGREFGCIKFRSMRRDADEIKLELQEQNKADGPQFFMEDDPRCTRIGQLLRKLDVDEWPQFLNVLKGDMSVVGPRPSPRKENQFCPQWREARLSVKPGITGLWQIKRSRRQGLDFQEWIRYDLEYVEKAGPLTDLIIISKTIALVLGKVLRS